MSTTIVLTAEMTLLSVLLIGKKESGVALESDNLVV